MHRLALVLGAVGQSWSGYGIWVNQSLWLGLGGHVLGAALWGWGSRCIQPSRSRESAWFGGVLALVMPGGGWLCSALAIWLLNGKPSREKGRTLLVWRHRNLRQEFELGGRLTGRSSIAEILRGPDPSSRRSAILAAKDLEVRLALPLLRKGLQDSDEQVRIYAQNILSGLLENFESRIKELEKRAQSHPVEVDTAVSLAEQYFELVYLDVAGDEETSDHLLAKAMAMLDAAAERSPRDGRIAMLRLRYALRRRNTVEAESALAKVHALNVDNQMVLPWHIELAFQQKNWGEMRRLFREFVDRGFVNPRIEALARFWRIGEGT